MRVKVYRNLRDKCYSILGTNGRLLGHTQNIYLEDVKFVVRPAGRARVLKEGRKNVHAFVCGEWIPQPTHIIEAMEVGMRISYNPYISNSFFNTFENIPITKANAVALTPNGCFLCD